MNYWGLWLIAIIFVNNCGIWVCAGAFALENMATFALAVNFVSYFVGFMHYELADAANMVTNFMGVGYILTIVVAVFADTWIGRHKSVLISGCFEFLVSFIINMCKLWKWYAC